MAIVPVTGEAFYEIAWRARLALIEPWCAEPGANPLRIIHRLELHELDNQLGLDMVLNTATGEKGYSGAFRWYRRPTEPGGTLPTGVPPFLPVAVRDREMMVPSYADFGAIPGRWVAHHLQSNRYDAIAELGSGLGRNLFSIYYNGGPPGPYFACEFAESGRRITQMLAALDPAIAMRVLPFDHKAPELSFLAGFKRVLLLTVHSIEQIDRLPDTYFDTLAAAAPEVTAMHFEPFGFQLGRDNDVSRRQRDHFTGRGWNLDLLEKLRDADKRGAIRLTFLSDNLWGNTLENPTSVAIWEKPVKKRK
jgi:hypothetical protein